MKINDFRKRWLQLQRKYERQAFRRVMSGIKNSTRKIPFDRLNNQNYRAVLNSSITYDDLMEAYQSIYLLIAREHGMLIGKAINAQIKNFDPTVFTNNFRRQLIMWVMDNVGGRIISVRQNLIEHIVNIIVAGIEQGRSVDDLAREIQDLVGQDSFYRWQALRIARTEAGAAANYGALLAGQSSGVLMEKRWISSDDARTRRTPPNRFDHLDMNDVRVGMNENFIMGSDSLRFPCDPRGSAANVINCRCAVSLVPKRDPDGNLIFLD